MGSAESAQNYHSALRTLGLLPVMLRARSRPRVPEQERRSPSISASSRLPECDLADVLSRRDPPNGLRVEPCEPFSMNQMGAVAQVNEHARGAPANDMSASRQRLQGGMTLGLDTPTPPEPVGEHSNGRIGIDHHAPDPVVGGALWLSGVDCSMEFVDGRHGGQAYGGEISSACCSSSYADRCKTEL